MSDGPLSLYFKLEGESTADLEIISAAAIAWVETMRAAAQAINPSSDIRVRLVDVDRSSAIYNTVVEWFERHVEPHLERLDRGMQEAPRSKRLLLGLVPFIVVTAVPTWDHYFGDEFTEEDRKLLESIRNNVSVETARRKFFRTLEREPRIVAVGLRETPDSPPVVMIPSDQFAEAGGLWAIEQDGDPVQVTHPVLEVVLVKPALVHTPRAWTFKPQGLPEFDAVMRDPVVLRTMEQGGLPERLREGIPMTIRLEVREVLVNGQWRVVRGGRSVVRVISPKLD